MKLYIGKTVFNITDGEVFFFNSLGQVNSPLVAGKKFDKIIPDDMTSFEYCVINGVPTWHNKRYLFKPNKTKEISEEVKVKKKLKAERKINDKKWGYRNVVSDIKEFKFIRNYKFKYKYDYTSSKKLIYQIHIKKRDIIDINSKKFNVTKGDVFRIFLENKKYSTIINDKVVDVCNNLNTITYRRKKSIFDKENLSVCIPMSLYSIFDTESIVNFDFTLNKYLTSDLDLNICISHTELEYNTFLDSVILENKINYIFSKNPHNFNLGYNRNLWKYISNDNKIMFTDIDIHISDNIIKDMISKSKEFDIVKPYDKRLIHTTQTEKYDLINEDMKPTSDINSLFTITGGTTLFDKGVLLETGGYEEYNSYGYEDRALDVIILEKGYTYKCLDNEIYHLYHKKAPYKSDIKLKKNLITTTVFHKKYYNCLYDVKNKKHIHELCKHNTLEVDSNIEFNRKYNGDLNLFESGNINSAVLKKNRF